MLALHLSTRELAFIAVFASMWIAAQTALGPVAGRFSLGPLNMHGAVNHVVGWFLMVITASTLERFGRVSTMTFIAALGTRIIRVSALEGALVGLGYAAAGLVFDAMYFAPIVSHLKGRKREIYVISIAVVSAIVTLIPFLIFRFYAVGAAAFSVLLPVYTFSMGKNIFFSFLGVSMGMTILPTLKKHSSQRYACRTIEAES